ncbi:hypothetical protein TYRP_015028 [Tyrophagus putrescentiae]|nr:hypothetical protein TYRP_015028 [Tyrophagus putrescentiae]
MALPQKPLLRTFLFLFLVVVVILTTTSTSHLVNGHMSSLVPGCPSITLIKPCFCAEFSHGLEIVCDGVQLDALRKVFEMVKEPPQTLMQLKMTNSNMTVFPAHLLSGIDVRHLMAHQCGIETVDQSAFAGHEESFESIDFSGNKFSQIPSLALRNLTSLVLLNLNFNQIGTLEANAFTGLASLRRLSLYGNRIVTLSPAAFLGVGVNLTRLNLGGNQLATVPTEAFRPLLALQRLQLHENSIRGPLDFSRLGSAATLEGLNLANNEISRLEEGLFAGLKSIKSLEFEGNCLAAIDDAAFRDIEETLEWLKLGENQLTAVPRIALANLTKLIELDLRSNLISKVEANDFAGYGVNIKFLYLQKNRIDNIEVGAFDKLHSLEWLDLHSNQLKHLPAVVFEQVLSKIQMLIVHGNPLVCSCSLRWYPKWVQSSGDKHQMVLLTHEISCTMSKELAGAAEKSAPVMLAVLEDSLTCATTSPTTASFDLFSDTALSAFFLILLDSVLPLLFV